MIDLKQIESFYPKSLQPFKKNILREYLQYKILEIIYSSKFADKLSFMGGTAIRILHGNSRFSEDLDFDNLDLDEKHFTELTRLIEKQLKREGYTTEIKNVFKNAYRCYLRFPNIFYETLLSPHKQEKLLIQIDTEPQQYTYQADKTILNKFDIFLQIKAAPLDLLLAQKISCIFKRPRAMGRDFYDTVFLLGKTKPDYCYLKEKLQIDGSEALKKALFARCEKLDLKHLAQDVEPFLFHSEDKKKVLLFKEYLVSSAF